jgi:hypothetical protein
MGKLKVGAGAGEFGPTITFAGNFFSSPTRNQRLLGAAVALRGNPE